MFVAKRLNCNVFIMFTEGEDEMGLFDVYNEEKCFLLLKDVHIYMLRASTKLNCCSLELINSKACDMIEGRIFYLFLTTALGCHIEQKGQCKNSKYIRKANNRLINDIKDSTANDYNISKSEIDNLFEMRFQYYMPYLENRDHEELYRRYVECAIDNSYNDKLKVIQEFCNNHLQIFENAEYFITNNKIPPL